MKDTVNTKIESNKLYKKMGKLFNTLKTSTKVAKKKAPSATLACSVTGALNHLGLRQFFDQVIPSELKNINVIYFEIDSFDEIIKQYSQKFSDKILQKFIAEIKKTLDADDIISRWDSKGFIVISPEKSTEHAADIADHARVAIKNNTWSKGLKVTCSTWVGQLNNTEMPQLIALAKETFNKAKHTGGNRAFVDTTREIVIPEEKRLEDDLNSMSCPLTGALNRTGMRSFFDQASTNTLENMSAIFIDINEFDQIEKNNGKHTSNEILKQFVAEINKSCSADGIISRLSSNEYLLACPKTGLEDAVNLAEKIKFVMQNKAWPKGAKVSCNTQAYDKGFTELNVHAAKIHSQEVENKYITAA